jgi:spore coat polysaccharide biosynthesis protein SpsF
MRAVVIVQARMGSSRLPGKVLLPLGDGCLLDYVVDRCLAIPLADAVVVATTDTFRDDVIAFWCERKSVPCSRGPEADVLSRFVQAAQPYQPDYIVRVTGDNPFFDYRLADVMLRRVCEQPADVVRLNEPYPLGMACEVVSFDALLRLDRFGTEPRHREHVTFYAYEFPEQFSSVTVDVPEPLRRVPYRFTIDTEEDYRVSRFIAEAFPGDRLVPCEEVVELIRNRPDVAEWNANVRQKPVV